MPAQVEVGRMWHIGEINVAEEHFASATTKTVMAQLMARAQFSPSNGKTMLAAAVAGNQLDIGPQAVADFFEMDGWRTVQLGADVPTGDIVKSVDFFGVDMLGLSASQSTQLETVRETIKAVRLAQPRRQHQDTGRRLRLRWIREFAAATRSRRLCPRPRVCRRTRPSTRVRQWATGVLTQIRRIPRRRPAVPKVSGHRRSAHSRSVLLLGWGSARSRRKRLCP